MDTGASLELTQLISLGLVIAVSPLTIIPVILVLQSPRPRSTGLAFLAGWTIGLALLEAVFMGVSGLLGGMGERSPAWASWSRVVIGALLIVFGVFRWFTRHRAPHQIPGARHVTEAGPVKALLLGSALTVVNLKVLIVCAVAGLTIGAAGMGNGAVLAAVVFVVVSASTVALPVLGYVLSGGRLEPAFERLEAWMEKHSAVLVVAILLIIGVMVLRKGLLGL